jgi:hypothetical protein
MFLFKRRKNDEDRFPDCFALGCGHDYGGLCAYGDYQPTNG